MISKTRCKYTFILIELNIEFSLELFFKKKLIENQTHQSEIRFVGRTISFNDFDSSHLCDGTLFIGVSNDISLMCFQ